MKVTSSGTRVSPKRLYENADVIEQNILDYGKSITRLYEIGESNDSKWKGEASDKFMTLLGNDQPKFVAMQTTLNRFVEIMREEAALYERTEQEAAAIAAK